MRRNLFLAVLVVLAVGILGAAAQIAVQPRVVQGALLFDNVTGKEVHKLAVMFDRPSTVTEADVTVFGGSAAKVVPFQANFEFYRLFYIEASVVPGGTLQILTTGIPAGAVITAYWIL